MGKYRSGRERTRKHFLRTGPTIQPPPRGIFWFPNTNKGGQSHNSNPNCQNKNRPRQQTREKQHPTDDASCLSRQNHQHSPQGKVLLLLGEGDGGEGGDSEDDSEDDSEGGDGGDEGGEGGDEGDEGDGGEGGGDGGDGGEGGEGGEGDEGGGGEGGGGEGGGLITVAYHIRRRECGHF
ncbi:MAG: hypothetical protein HYV66_03210 [Candidatus Sungbacteria bacterium]|uniref:Uncharacterized protein n=1 Tax=Candidatus Sungiibacteriota bacterium TaxID=2750080 RepID=A0A931YE42_9BACT|nr:hypothetical protein [Candidatus Sungbacteria bacterium]